MNYTGLWDARLTWYSPSLLLWLLEYGLKIHSFSPTWTCLMFKLLTIQVKFLFFHTANIYGLFQIHKAYVSELDSVVFSSVCLSNLIHGVKQYMTYQRIYYHNTTNHSRYLPQLELPQSLDTCLKVAHTKILQNFWLTLVAAKNNNLKLELHYKLIKKIEFFFTFTFISN